MQLIKNTNIDFMSKRVLAMVLSAVLLAVSLGSIMVRGLNLGIDFSGGVLVEVGYSNPVVLDPIRQQLSDAGYGDAVVQFFGAANDVLIRLAPQDPPTNEQLAQSVVDGFNAAGISATLVSAGEIEGGYQNDNRSTIQNNEADFRQGTALTLDFETGPTPEQITSVFSFLGYDNIHRAAGEGSQLILSTQRFNSSVISNRILNVLGEDASMRRVEFVGPQVGEELTEQGGLAMLFALLMILAYVAFRFQWKFALGSVIALVHDVLITIGMFSFFQWPFDLPVLAAVLAVIGYSLNDTIVVFDRIRENFLKIRKSTAESIMNTSLNQTLARTIITSLTTLIVLTALFLLGGEAIHYFALALIVGVLLGTYSSIYIASASALMLDVTTEDLLPPTRPDDPELDAIP
ncbi:MAG: protein translocase subunit SecF [Pseudomonadota bacterium]